MAGAEVEVDTEQLRRHRAAHRTPAHVGRAMGRNLIACQDEGAPRRIGMSCPRNMYFVLDGMLLER